MMVWMLMWGCASSVPSDVDVSFPAWASDTFVSTATLNVAQQDLTVGTGNPATAGDRVTVHYKGWLTDGTLFDTSHTRGQPFSATLGQREVIDGWDQGVRGMQVGGTRGMVLPPHLAYGEAGVPPTIPGGSTLVFEIELVALDQP